MIDNLYVCLRKLHGFLLRLLFWLPFFSQNPIKSWSAWSRPPFFEAWFMMNKSYLSKMSVISIHHFPMFFKPWFFSLVPHVSKAFQQAALLNNNWMPWRNADPWGRPNQRTLLRPRQCYEGAPVKVLPSSQAWLATNEDTVLVAGDVLPIMNHKWLDWEFFLSETLVLQRRKMTGKTCFQVCVGWGWRVSSYSNPKPQLWRLPCSFLLFKTEKEAK